MTPPKIGGYNELIYNTLQKFGLTYCHQPGCPEIRFRGFTEPWEEMRISDVVSFSKGRGYSKADLLPTGNPILLYGSLYTRYKTSLTATDTFADIRNNSVISRGNEVVVPASGETAQDIARATAILSPGIILGGDLNILITNRQINSSFLALDLTYGRSHYRLVSKAQGASVVHLHNSDFAGLCVVLPQIDEQIKISQFFIDFDDMLTSRENEIYKFCSLKQGLLDKMFVN